MQCNPRAGALSLLREAIGAQPGQTLAIVAENPQLGVYDAMVPVCVADVASELGINARIIEIGNLEGIDQVPPLVGEALASCDHVLFHSRLGDTLRFTSIPGRATKTMSYALDMGLLGGPACTLSHRVLERIRTAYDAHANRTRRWRVTCPLGTDISGTQDVEAVLAGRAEDFTLKRYPVCAPRPLACNTASGVVVLARWLIASGNRNYDNSELLLPEPLRAHVEMGQIVEFSGPKDAVNSVRGHYSRVGDYFGINPFIVHSWHAGINPGAYYPVRANTDLERWGKVAFANPRYLHFHTCGNYAPGEISWTIIDGSAEFDGLPFWKAGAFVFLDSQEVKAILADEGLAGLETRRDIGVD